MTKFLVSARKYRPQTFGELVSQDHVGETLRNAIRLDRLAHAYLFCGPRGVGKTSVARILAKTINCSTPFDERSNLDPCRKCQSCISFEEGRSLNVIEIDAASNNKVEDIHALRDSVRVPPQLGTKKVYIIDEVHMLSKQAFNALLKTLEEPPPYVQFLFATTEPQKVIPTILSRCQRFDFHRISIPDIVKQLRLICEKEGIEADDASLRLIAGKGDGSLRDAFSTFDQSVLLCGNNLKYQSLVEALGIVDIDVYFDTARLIAEHDRAELLRVVERLITKGYDIHEFLLGLTDHMRNLLVAVTMQSTDLIETDRDTAERYVEQGPLFHEMDLLRHLIVVDETLDALRRSVKPRLRLELALLKMASLGKAADLRQILQHLPGAGDPAPKLSLPSRTEVKSKVMDSAAAAAATTTETAETNQTPETPETAETAETTESSETPAPPESLESVESPESPESPKGSEPKVSATPELMLVEPGKVEPAEVEPAEVQPVAQPTSGSSEKFFGTPAITTRPTRVAPGPAGGHAREGGPDQDTEGAVVSLSRIETVWDSYIKAVMKDRIHVGALLQHAKPSSVVGRTIEIAVPDVFHEKLLGSESTYLAGKLASALSLDPPPTVRVVVSETEAARDSSPELDIGERIQKLKDQNPIIAALIDNFGGEVVW